MTTVSVGIWQAICEYGLDTKGTGTFWYERGESRPQNCGVGYVIVITILAGPGQTGLTRIIHGG